MPAQASSWATHPDDGHLDGERGIGVDELEVDVGDGAAHGVALPLLDDRQSGGALDGEVDQGVQAGVGGRRPAQLGQSTATGTASVPRPYTTAGIFPVARSRLAARVPVSAAGLDGERCVHGGRFLSLGPGWEEGGPRPVCERTTSRRMLPGRLAERESSAAATAPITPGPSGQRRRTGARSL